VGERRALRAYFPLVAAINALEPPLRAAPDAALAARAAALRARAAAGEPERSLLVEAFALVREAARRVLGLRAYDVQLVGGMALAEGRVAEMKTGEGKTLAAALPAFLYALSAKGVHVVTVNDYLADRDARWVGKIFHFLGMSVGVVTTATELAQRRQAFACDVTYVTAHELAFTFLRDNLAVTPAAVVRDAPCPRAGLPACRGACPPPGPAACHLLAPCRILLLPLLTPLSTPSPSPPHTRHTLLLPRSACAAPCTLRWWTRWTRC
jgi:preprotein translocase subunit SecA